MGLTPDPERQGVPAPPRFVVFEGLDHAGKTTQVALLRDWLQRRSHRVTCTREPTHGGVGAVIHRALRREIALAPATLALAFAADRSEHLTGAGGIAERLEAGEWVLCDRYVLSSLAYQTGAGVSMDWVAAINRVAIAPAVTFFVDTDPATCVARMGTVGSELFHDVGELRRVRANYSEAFRYRRFAGRLVVVDGDRPPDMVADDVVRRLAEVLELPADR